MAGAAADGTHGSNIAVILKSLTENAALAKEAHEYNMVKFVTELSLEELMAGQLSGDTTTAALLAQSHTCCHRKLLSVGLLCAMYRS